MKCYFLFYSYANSLRLQCFMRCLENREPVYSGGLDFENFFQAYKVHWKWTALVSPLKCCQRNVIIAIRLQASFAVLSELLPLGEQVMWLTWHRIYNRYTFQVTFYNLLEKSKSTYSRLFGNLAYSACIFKSHIPGLESYFLVLKCIPLNTNHLPSAE